ncbi:MULTISPECIES: hypothetical protein [Actinomycetes]|uniref:hypothetical protein n=1 Tax=Actinomycetes TaxID=1760 RepID=UPI0004BEF112|nr:MULTISPECIES: hypothetical protein [Actinomycetes]
MTSTAETLLLRAGALLDSPTGPTIGNSARLAAFLTRQAVEDLIDERCAQLCGIPVLTGSAKAKLAVLKSLDTTPMGAVLIDSWYQLTMFCHQHAYQLSPTVSEVRAQCNAISAILRSSQESV